MYTTHSQQNGMSHALLTQGYMQSTEEYLRTHVFGEQARMADKRRANVENFARPAMTMEECVRYAVFGEDLPPHLDGRCGAGCAARAVGASAEYGQRGRRAGASTAVAATTANVQTGAPGGGQPDQPASAPIPAPASSHAVLQVIWQRDAENRIVAKREVHAAAQRDFVYGYDARGRLAFAVLNGHETERYVYNAQGQRVQDVTAWRGQRTLVYDAQGRLVQAGSTVYEYTPEGALLRRIETGALQEGGLGPITSVTSFSYGADTRLDSVQMPDGTQLTYLYGASLGPVEKHVNGHLAESYLWLDATRLSAWIDHQHGVRCLFHYGEDGRAAAVTVESAQGLAKYRLGLDQVGTLKVVATSDGMLIKEIAYDSFGNVIGDSNPALFLPIGFASGLVDRHTGLVRFGYRDYLPEAGRFTAVDPARDMRGDGDLWDYCADDPINAVDPLGLFVFLLPFAAGMLGATALGYSGTKLAAYLADKASGKEGVATKAVDEPLKEVAKGNAALVAAAAIPEAAAALAQYGPAGAAAVKEGIKGAATFVRNKGLDAANAVLSRPETINAAALGASDFITGYKLNGPYEPTRAGAAGFILSAAERAVEVGKKVLNEKVANEEK